MAQQWHYSHGGKQLGPVSAAELRQLAASGRLARTDMVWKEGLANWVRAEQINGLFIEPTLNSPPPLPASPPPQASQTTPQISISIPPQASKLIAQMHRQRLAIAAAAAIGILATFLPWVHAPIVGSVSGARGDGWITLLLFVPAMVLVFRGAKSEPLIGNYRLGAAIPAGLASAIGMWKFISFNAGMADLARENPFGRAMAATTGVGIGIYLLIIAGVALVAVSWLLVKSPEQRTTL